MKRALIVATGTVAGVGAVLGLNPTGHADSGSLAAGAIGGLTDSATTGGTVAGSGATAPSPTPSSPSATPSVSVGGTPSTTPKAPTTPTPSATPKATTPTDTAQAKTVNGPAVESGYGPVQVSVSGTATSISKITILQYPTDDRHSLQISQYALPELVSQTMKAQSAKIDGVSGATYTSRAFYASLVSALKKLKA